MSESTPRRESLTEPTIPAFASADEAPRRFRVFVREPKAMLALGKPPSDVGYDGATLHTGMHLLLDVGKNANWHVGGVTTLFFAKDTYVYAGAWAQVSKGEYTLASKKRALLVAGAGYADEAPVNAGEGPEPRAFNTVDLEALSGAWSSSTAKWEKSFHSTLRTNLGALGLAVAGEARVSDGYLERFTASGESTALSRLLGKTSGLLERAERLSARPELLPVAGPLLTRIKEARKVSGDLTKSTDAVHDVLESVRHAKSSWLREKARVEKAQKGLYPGAKKGEESAAKPSGAAVILAAGDAIEGGIEQADKALKFAAQEAPAAVLRPTRRVVAEIKEATESIKAVVDSAASALGVRAAGAKAAVGVLGKQGVTIASGEKVVGVAHGGFYFVSAPSEKSGASLLSQMKTALGSDGGAAAKAKALGSVALDRASGGVSSAKELASEVWSGGEEEPQVASTPGFVVRVDGAVELLGSGDALLGAAGEGSVARVGAGRATEVFAKEAVSLGARAGTAEVLGATVTVGLPPREGAARDKRASVATTAMAEAKTAVTKAEAEVAKAKLELEAAKTKLQSARAAVAVTLVGGAMVIGATAGGVTNAEGTGAGTRVAGVASTAGLGAVSLASWALDKAYDTWNDAKKKLAKAEAKLEEAKARAALAEKNSALGGKGSITAYASESRSDAQSATKNVQVWATDAIELEATNTASVHAKRVTVGSYDPGDGKLSSEAVGVEATTVTIKAGDKLTLEVGGFTLVLSTSGIEASSSGGAKIALSNTDAKVTVGACSVKVDNTGIDVSGTNVRITGNASLALN